MTQRNSGLSTSWQSGLIQDGVELLDVVGASGLSCLEIDYRVSRETLRQMEPRLRSGEFTVLSLHNYCPTPPGYEGHHNVAALFNPASLDAEERKLAVRHSIRTIQTAADLGARLVVFHLGIIDMDFRMKELFQLHEEEGGDSSAFQKRMQELQQERAEKAGAHWTPLLRTVETVHAEAHKRGILMGVENRYRLSQIPVGDEFDLLFNEFEGGELRYWHDVGHAEVFARLGLLDHERDLLQRGLVDRGGHQGVDPARPRPLNRGPDGHKGRPAAAAINPPHLHRSGEGTRVKIGQALHGGADLGRFVHAAQGPHQTGLRHGLFEDNPVPEEEGIKRLPSPYVRQGLEHDLRTDAGRIAEGDADQGFHNTPFSWSRRTPSRNCARSTGSCASMMRRLSSPR